MYYRGTAQPENIPAPNGNVVGPFIGPISWTEDPHGHAFPAEKPQNENDNSVIFVHGWSMNYPDYISFSETMFKRLWQMGFNGRFCTLRWDPLVVGQTGVVNVSNGEYNRSEHRAWLYGESLKQFAESIKGKGLRSASLATVWVMSSAVPRWKKAWVWRTIFSCKRPSQPGVLTLAARLTAMTDLPRPRRASQRPTITSLQTKKKRRATGDFSRRFTVV